MSPLKNSPNKEFKRIIRESKVEIDSDYDDSDQFGTWREMDEKLPCSLINSINRHGQESHGLQAQRMKGNNTLINLYLMI